MVTLFPPPTHLPPPGALSLWDTKQLANALAIRGGAMPPPPLLLDTLLPPMGKGGGGRGGSMSGGGGGSGSGGMGGSGSFRPKYKHSGTVPIGIPLQGDGFLLRRKLLGNQASLVLQIVNSIASPQTMQIRLRGIGSGFKEGVLQLEFNEPLHFVISAEDENELKLGLVKVQEHVHK
eukprot:gene15798-33329_t